MLLREISEKFIKSGEFNEFMQRKKNEKISIEGIAPSSFPLIISSLYNHSPGQLLVITKNFQKMHEVYLDLSCFIDAQYLCTLPPWETLPYEFVSPSENLERERVATLYRIINQEPVIVVATVESLVRKIPERSFFIRKGIPLSVGEEYPFDDIITTLIAYGYSREYRVESFGQFSVKGGIIDIFLSSHQTPVRLDFFGDTLDSIREFDIESQVSHTGIPSITIYPRKELILSQKESEIIRSHLGDAEERGLEVPQYEELTTEMGNLITDLSGIEDLFPIAIKTENILSYLSEDAKYIYLETPELIAQMDQLSKTFHELYRRRTKRVPCLPPDELIDSKVFDDALTRAIELKVFTTTRNALNWKLRRIPTFHGKIKSVREEISGRLEDNWRIIITTGFEGQARRLYDLFSEFTPDSNFEKINTETPVNILIAPLKEGFEIVSEKILILTDHEIFGKTYRRKIQFKKKRTKPIESFLDLKEGSYVVHINHGIGIFRGIERMSAGGVERDFLLIEYADSDKLYVSLDQITMVQSYIGIDSKKPRIDSLGKKSAWNRIKDKVQKSVEEIAGDLIEIYSKRRALKGFQFPPDTMWQEEFESKFEYEETPDQITTIEDVKDDMESTQPADRVICGDVGFGKTEVAIRASFKAVMAGKQVAMLVPTTVLAMQHFTTFTKRFIDYPINIEMLSRFRTRREINDVKKKLSSGEVDIVIGTHALLAKSMAFKNIGLLIIDEEQRFGVNHKEQLKKLRTLVDVITLSATPIPRTLHMAVAGIRDLSIIATPPENRQSIDTYVLEENPDIIRMAIMREIERDGQVFYVHNRVETIDAQQRILSELVPEAIFCIAHGQMKEHELEEVMIDFLAGKYDVLISTTIIESGLDMPNVNTIIIDRADTFGLSQLYQLKGRVGRSIRKAYAYLFYPRHIPLTEAAQKRLQVIAEYSELGSGYKIAMKDLEIRGSGNILGREQSGNIMDVGFDLYCQMLEDAVRKLKGEKPIRIFRTPVFLNTNFYIPAGYIADERQKIEFYKRFESCETLKEVEQVEGELIDRFGDPPGEVKILIELERIRAIASNLEIDEIIEESRSIRIRISAESRVDRNEIIESIKKDKRLNLDSKDRELLYLKLPESDEEKKLLELKKWLQQIS
jgi:transcription-repair coupling factor (superfamily II helicase)